MLEETGGFTFKCKHGTLGTDSYCQGCFGRPRYYSDGERGWDKVADATAYNRMIHNKGLPPGDCNEEPLEWTGITWANATINTLRARLAELEAALEWAFSKETTRTFLANEILAELRRRASPRGKE